MINLKQKVIDEFKIIGLSLIPYACAREKTGKLVYKIRHGKELERTLVVGDFSARDSLYALVNMFVSAGTLLVFGSYMWASIGTGTIDYRKWGKIMDAKKQERIIQREIYEKNVLDQSFKYFDSNLNGEISKEEFKEGIEKVKGYEGRNFYDDLNWELEINENRIDVQKYKEKK